jgi:hypothetical protein
MPYISPVSQVLNVSRLRGGRTFKGWSLVEGDEVMGTSFGRD